MSPSCLRTPRATKQKKNELTELPEATEVAQDEGDGRESAAVTADTSIITPTAVRPRGKTSPVSPVIRALVEVITDALGEGESVTLPGLGSFAVHAYPARTGRNPRTGESIEIPAGERVHFKASSSLRASLNQQNSAQVS